MSIDFSVKVISYAELLESHKKFVVARQLLRSATSIGANSREAQNAESTKHFISKFKIAIREADETEYWLMICLKADSYSKPARRIIFIFDLNHQSAEQDNFNFSQKDLIVKGSII